MQDINLDSDSSEEMHPNIDERSYKNWKRQQREQSRRALAQRLEEINAAEARTTEMLQEKERIEEMLQPQYRCFETGSFRMRENESESDYIAELEHLVEHSDLGSFIALMDSRRIEMEKLEDLILHNLAEQIKEGNDAEGLVLSRLSVYAKYALSHGREFLQKLNAQLTDRQKRAAFEADCRRDFEETKRSFLAHFSAQSADK